MLGRTTYLWHHYWQNKKEFAKNSDIYPVWTLFAVENGSFSYIIGEIEGDGTEGDLVLCPPDIPFGRKVIQPLSFHFLHFNVEPNPILDSCMYFYPLQTGAMRISRDWLPRFHSTCALLREMPAPQGAVGEHQPAVFQHLLDDLLLTASLKPPAPAVQTAVHDPLMAQAWARLTEEACGKINLRGLARELKLTPVQLTRRFRAAYAVNPSEYVTSLRMRRACRLLEESMLTLEEIAEQCGYENGYYLSRVFRKQLGMSPSAYRDRSRV
ncbi:AraC family transcriptional regulator [Paenibacillus sp. P96]|uniref:AraC family transcriptional regulator n=1 Tax=Paenibacillus zeirhizosphaerae TaxID=2987519 RepID=A0ABT9FTK4_9BACL|nr:AraC family transcriptional regulator [Paenibacillus sp. P96]MDP4097826.1 AraC family transcriptional regulator [Paenibacillus sp. P96]